MPGSRRLGAVAAATLVLALVGGCGDDEDRSQPSASRSDSASSAPEVSTPVEDPTSEPTGTPTTDATTEPTPDPVDTLSPAAVPTTSAGGAALSPSPATASPVRRPGAVRGLRVVRQLDGRVLLAWQAPRSSGSPVTGYRIATSGTGRIVQVASTTAWVTGLENGAPASFGVWAVNAKGEGPRSVVLGQGAGRPDVPVLDDPVIANSADRAVKHVMVRWGAVAPNGPGPVEYSVTASGGRQVCGGSGWTTSASCSDSVPNDGHLTSYTVRARNAEATSGRSAPGHFTSAASGPATVEAAATPHGVTNLRAVATGADGQARVTFDVGPSHGRENVILCSPGCGNLASTRVSTTGAAGVSFLINGFPDGNLSSVSVWTCNGSSGSAQSGSSCSASVTDQVSTFGPLGTPTVNVHPHDTCFEWQVSGDANGKPATLVILAQGFAQTWVITGPATRIGSYCPGFGQTRTFTVLLQDSGASSEQPVDRGTRQASTTALTTPSA